MFGMFRTFDRIMLSAVAAAAVTLTQAAPGLAQAGPDRPDAPVQTFAPPALGAVEGPEETAVKLGTVEDGSVGPGIFAAGGSTVPDARATEMVAEDAALPVSSDGLLAEEAVGDLPPTEGQDLGQVRLALPQGPLDKTFSLEAVAAGGARFLRDGGPAIWAIAALSVATLALIFWKTWRLALNGAWSRGRAVRAVAAWEQGNIAEAQAMVAKPRSLRARVVAAALRARLSLPDQAAREDTSRVAKYELAEAASGLRALELIATIAPLLGLLGTVMGMISAFQALQESGSRADPAMLAGGIWEALLTTAAGMAVAIPASAALTWFEAVIDRMRRDVEDAAVRIFVTQLGQPQQPSRAAE
jgi:biopolymer transport protein ExbB